MTQYPWAKGDYVTLYMKGDFEVLARSADRDGEGDTVLLRNLATGDTVILPVAYIEPIVSRYLTP